MSGESRLGLGRRAVRDALPQDEFDSIFSRVPRLTVEVVIADRDLGVLLTLRESGPCEGLWHIPGGTVRFGEPLVDAVARVALGELGLEARAGELLGYIEYPSHYENGLDSPVGLAFRTAVDGDLPEDAPGRRWFKTLPDSMHDEQRVFLVHHLGSVLRSESQ